MTALLLGVAGVLGLAVGSFLNVVIWRVPRGESVVRPPSHCPGCDHPVRHRDNVPLLSWLVLRGRCRDCGIRISARYPAVELLTGVVFVVLAAAVGLTPALPAFLYLGGVGVALAMIDLDTQRLPDVLTLPSYVVGTVLLGAAGLVGDDYQAMARAGIGLCALYGFYFLLAFVYPAGMGFGDVKLAGVLGLYLGWVGFGSLVVGAFAGFLLGGIGSILLLTRGAGRKTAVPFGPYMLAGALLAIVAGQALSGAYLDAAFGG